MLVNIRAALTHERDRLTKLLSQMEHQQKVLPRAPGSEELSALIATIKSAIDQLELALGQGA